MPPNEAQPQNDKDQRRKGGAFPHCAAAEPRRNKVDLLSDPLSYFASATTFSAASFIPLATVKFKLDSRITRWPSSTFVPSRRTTTGTLIFSFFAASTTPRATISQRTM